MIKTLIILFPCLLLYSFATEEIPMVNKTSETKKSGEDSAPRCKLGLGVIGETLDALESELLFEKVCRGGEEIHVAMRISSTDVKILEIICRVPGVLQVYREAYIQNDGLVLLADELVFSDWERRYSMKPINDVTFTSMNREFSIRIQSCISRELSSVSRSRHLQRVERKKEAERQP